MSKRRTIKVSSVFPAAQEIIWPLLSRVETLQHIAAPYAYFKPLNLVDETWHEGDIIQFRFRVFGIIPMGIHTIQICEMDRKAGRITSKEYNRTVPVWNHTICLESVGKNSVHYTDKIEIDAGLITALVCTWAGFFYRHRQRKWMQLLSGRYI